MNFENIKLKILSDGLMGLDGGAMFGIVPKVMWERLIKADEKNRITLGMNSLYLEISGKKILVETGTGNKEKKKFLDIYQIRNNGGLLKSMSLAGIKPEEIDIVINTHLHFDHCGGNTVFDKNGNAVPTFPNADYYIQKGEWEEATGEYVRNKASYFENNLLPLEKSGQLRLIEGNCEIIPGVSVFLTPGHTKDHQCVLIESEGNKVCFMGDLVPMSHHLRLPFVMAYDIEPVVTQNSKRALYEKAIKEQWLLVFVHDTEIVAAYLDGSPEQPVLVPAIKDWQETVVTPVDYKVNT